MTETATTPTTAPAPAAPQTPFLTALVMMLRANDRFGALEKQPDALLLQPFVIAKEQRKALPLMADPDKRVLERLDVYWKAVSLRIEQRTSLMAGPILSLHHEGFGRVVVTVGKLIAISKTLRDVHRFGFADLEALEREGEKLVAGAVAAIEQFPEVARA